MTASGRPVSDSVAGQSLCIIVYNVGHIVPRCSTHVCAGLGETMVGQADLFMTNLTNIITTVNEVTPDGQDVDMGSLTVCFFTL